MFTASRARFEELLLAAKTAYIAQEQDQVVVKMIAENSSDDGQDHWRQVSLKNKRDLASVVTELGVKEDLEQDITEFCKSEKWYTSRGVPWRRGFLLHGEQRHRRRGRSNVPRRCSRFLAGVPGSGKTSLIHALASSCDLDIYVISLATAG